MNVDRWVMAAGLPLVSVLFAIPGARLPVTHVILAVVSALGLKRDALAWTVLLGAAGADALKSWPYTLVSIVAAFFASRQFKGILTWIVWIPSLLALGGTLWVWFEMGAAFGF